MSLLFEPIRIGDLTVKNRMVLPPMNTNFTNENGAVSPQMTQYYLDKAKKGVGLIVIEASSVSPTSKNHGVQPMIYDEQYIPGWFNLVDQLHQYDVKVSVQIAHYGSEGVMGTKVSPSNITKFKDSPTHTLSLEEIAKVEDEFAEAIRWAKVAGFDAITLHAAHGYLISQFMSPIYNKRTDEYGGALENRMRFMERIIEKARRKVGSGFPIIVRYCADEFYEGGRLIEESIEIARMLEGWGVAALDISSGMASSYVFNLRPYSFLPLEGFNLENVRRIKESVKSIPVFYAGGVREPEMAKRIVDDGFADLVCFGRALLADDLFCAKVKGESGDRIRYCLSCQECLCGVDDGRSLRCTVNPRTGREFFLPDELGTVEKAKKVVVVGSGPAGMEAAAIAAKRGHNVTLYETDNSLGGTLIAAAVPPCKERLHDLIAYYLQCLEDSGVKIKLNSEYTEEMARKDKPDALVLAQGGAFLRFIPGSESDQVITAVEALTHPEKVGQDIVIIGGGVTGCETAEYFSDELVEIDYKHVKNFDEEIEYAVRKREGARPRNITIIEMLPELCRDMDVFNKATMDIKLKEIGISKHLNTCVEAIDKGAVTLKNALTGEKSCVKADTVILAAGLKPRQCYRIDGVQVYCAGDNAKVGKIIDAIYQGNAIGRQI